jgi:hypothetical protein
MTHQTMRERWGSFWKKESYPFRVFLFAAAVLITLLSIIDLQSLPVIYLSWKVIDAAAVILLLAEDYVFFRILFKHDRLAERITAIRNRMPRWVRWAAAFISICFISWVLLYTRQGSYFAGNTIRLAIYLTLSALVGMLISDGEQLFNLKAGFLSLGLVGVIHGAAYNLMDVNNNPFSYSWSEGNRFYDYSLIFGKYIYQYKGELNLNYNYPGRYGLWGIWFLIPGLPIWVHRLWDAMLWIFTPVILGYLLARRIPDKEYRWGAALWIALFITQGPVYPSLLVALIILALFAWSDKFWVKVIFVILSSLYAGISRYFWAVIPGVWIVLIDLFLYYPKRKGNWFARLWQPALLGVLGIVPGVMVSWGSVFSASTPFEGRQPLLFYRWFPNSTYGQGILLGILITAAPALICLFWLVIKGYWKQDVWQKVAVPLAFAALFAMGAVASIKIGGGSNLHNFDLLLTTIPLMGVTAWLDIAPRLEKKEFTIPQWVLAVMTIAAILPGWFIYQGGSMLVTPSAEFTQKTLAEVQHQVDTYKSRGDILFIDQRQLLTFNAIKGVELISDYEKKYMMDQAMGDNAAYFEQFTQDIANQRFALIISDIQKTKKQTQDRAFSEENNAYVKWVSKPLLKYYKPILVVQEFGMELLVPIPAGEVQP